MKRSLTGWKALVISVGALTLGVLVPLSEAHATGAAGTKPGAGPARSGASGWRIYKAISIRGQSVLLGGIAAVSASDTWITGAAGLAGRSAVTPLVQRWNGTRWLPVTLPAAIAAGLARPGQPSVVGAASSRDAWIFGPAGKYAHLLGTRWTAGILPVISRGHALLGSAAVFGPSDAWAFGVQFSGGQHARLAPYAARFDGTAWRAVAVPGHGPLTVSAVSPDDMWAITNALPPVTGIAAKPAILRWNGATWRAEAMQPTLPAHATLSSIVAESDDDVWVGGSAPNGSGGTSELALHWDGTSWTTASPPAAPTSADYYLTSLVPDGSGGLWGVGEALPGTPRFWHYSAGAWSAPAEGSPRWVSLQLDQVPGTGSIWAIADNAGLTKGLILLHGSVPR